MRARTITVAVLLWAPACAKATRHAAPPPLETIDDIEAELQRNARQLAGLGLSVPGSTTAEPASAPPAEPAPDSERAGGEAEPAPADDLAQADEDAPELRSKGAVREVPARDRSVSRRGRRGAGKASSDRCERICDLAEVTCNLAGRICDMAQRHPGEHRYVAACRRAEDQCDVATRACDECAE